uniref:Uncharacterized protein n=1 Tax=Amphimedon queenslandica TaxID=400682 RepID=A0A1X7VBW9_AMPQE
MLFVVKSYFEAFSNMMILKTCPGEKRVEHKVHLAAIYITCI